jgi:hypothetical protein
MARRLVLAGGALALVVALVFALLQHGVRRSGTNMTPNPAFVAFLGAGQQVCQNQDILPGDTALLQFTAGTYGATGPPLEASVQGPTGTLLTSGTLRSGWHEGTVRIPVKRVDFATANTIQCVRNLGTHKIALAGYGKYPGNPMRLDGKPLEGHLRVEYLRSTHESWLALIPAIVHRFSLGKADLIRHWAAAGVLILMLMAVAMAAFTVLREEA